MTYAVVVYRNGHRDRCRAKDPNHCRFHTSSDVEKHMMFDDKESADRFFEEENRKKHGNHSNKLSKTDKRTSVCNPNTLSKAYESGKNVLRKADARHRMLNKIYTSMGDVD